jgi:hypothetical protein
MIQEQGQKDQPLELGRPIPGSDLILIIFPSAVRTFPTRAVAFGTKDLG